MEKKVHARITSLSPSLCATEIPAKKKRNGLDKTRKEKATGVDIKKCFKIWKEKNELMMRKLSECVQYISIMLYGKVIPCSYSLLDSPNRNCF